MNDNYFDGDRFRTGVAVSTGSLYTRLTYEPGKSRVLLRDDATVISAFKTMKYHSTGDAKKLHSLSAPPAYEEALELVRDVLAALGDKQEGKGDELALYGTLIAAVNRRWDEIYETEQ